LTVVCRLQILANQFRQVSFPKVSADHFELQVFGGINLSLSSLFHYHPQSCHVEHLGHSKNNINLSLSVRTKTPVVQLDETIDVKDFL